MKNQVYYLLLGVVFVLTSCNSSEKKDPATDPTFTYHNVIPVEFPDPDIPGFNFPEDSSTLIHWIRSSTEDSIYVHGWGIWTAITSKTDQYIQGHSAPLLTFETWLTPEEMIDSIKGSPVRRSNRANLKQPNQLAHFDDSNNLKGQQSLNDSIHESVSYSPAASGFAINNKIFMATTLYDYSKIQNRKEIPFFPNNAITIKPVFKLLQTSGGETKFNIASWHGPTSELKGYPEQDWGTFVTVDITNKSEPGGTTYNLDDFIHFKFNDEDAYYFNEEFTENGTNKFDAKEGDIAVLVAMHVATREIKNWTWQTFWWAPEPDNPPAPSSKAIADQRPSQLQGAARHYAMSVAYYMVNPEEPYSGKNITGTPNFAFNPYLEAGFGPDVFRDSLSYVLTLSGQKMDTVNTYVGVRTNCMSCHRMATVNPGSISTSNSSTTPYVGNSFVSISDPIFKDQLLLDFAWSIQGNLDTTGIKSYINK